MINPPILIFEGSDLRIERSVADAVSALEPADVKENIYTAFDSSGRLLELAVVHEEKTVLFGLFKTSIDTVKITPAENDPSHEGEIKNKLIAYLKAITKEQNLENLSTQELAAKAISHR